MAHNSPRVLILGGTGMLGSMLWAKLSRVPGWQVRRSQRRNHRIAGYFDALKGPQDLDALLAAEGGTDFIINAIGLTKPEIKEGDAASEEKAAAINAELPKRLGAVANHAGACVIHVSTDGVFSGRAGPYDEAMKPDPQDVYGHTKLAGEISGPHILTLRCSLIGPDPEKGRGLFEWFRHLTPDADMKGFTDQLWNGVTTTQLAELCQEIIASGVFKRLANVSSVRHFCPNPPVTKYELLRIFSEALNSGVPVIPVKSGTSLNRTLISLWKDLNDLARPHRSMHAAVLEMIRAGNEAIPLKL